MASRKIASTGATVTITSASAAPKGKASKKGAASPVLAPQTSPLPVVAAPVAVAPVKQAKAPQFAALTLGAKKYRVKAAHNMAAMDAIIALMKDGPAPVPAVLTALAAHPAVGGASGFVGYCVRRGYLQAS